MIISDDWLPTSENINALPEPLRAYVHNLETNYDPTGIAQENAILSENCKALQMLLTESEEPIVIAVKFRLAKQ